MKYQSQSATLFCEIWHKTTSNVTEKSQISALGNHCIPAPMSTATQGHWLITWWALLLQTKLTTSIFVFRHSCYFFNLIIPSPQCVGPPWRCPPVSKWTSSLGPRQLYAPNITGQFSLEMPAKSEALVCLYAVLNDSHVVCIKPFTYHHRTSQIWSME